MVEIGLTDLAKSGGGVWNSRHTKGRQACYSIKDYIKVVKIMYQFVILAFRLREAIKFTYMQ